MGGIALLQDVAQVGKPARSHSPFKMMGSFPELHRNPDQHSRKLVCDSNAKHWRVVGRAYLPGLPHFEGQCRGRLSIYLILEPVQRISVKFGIGCLH
jgi:hypothetical protein